MIKAMFFAGGMQLLSLVTALSFSLVQQFPDIYHVGRDVTAPTVMSRVEAQYSEAARAARVQGTVVLEAVISADGVPRVVRVVRSLGYGMDESAIDPVQRRWGALAALGARAFEFRDLVAGHLDFLGRSACELANLALRPHTLRLRALTAQFEQACLNAIPVVVLVTFLIGVVLAYLLGLQTEKYGANIFVVDGVAIGTCRELAPIMVAVIVAGRSGAAFTAQIGTMLLTEEIDAIRTLGLSPMQVLVVPRLLSSTSFPTI